MEQVIKARHARRRKFWGRGNVSKQAPHRSWQAVIDVHSLFNQVQNVVPTVCVLTATAVVCSEATPLTSVVQGPPGRATKVLEATGPALSRQNSAVLNYAEMKRQGKVGVPFQILGFPKSSPPPAS